MVEKRFAVRLVTDGGERVRAEMQGVGKAAHQAFAQVTDAQKSAAGSADVFNKALDAEMASFQQLRAALDPLYAASKRYEDAQGQINVMLAKGLITQSEANRVLQLAEQRHLAVADAAVKAGNASDLHQRELRDLRMELDPLFAVSQRYEAQLDRIADAEQRGAITAGVAAQARDRAAQMLQSGSRDTVSAAQAAGNETSKFGMIANQVGFQIQDVFVQAPLSGWFRAIAQQAPQAAGAFSMLGGSIGTIVSWLGTAVAVGMAVVPMLGLMGDEAESADEKVDSLKQALQEYRAAADEATMSTEDLRKKYGDLADEVREALVARMEEAAYDAKRALSEALTGVGEEFTNALANMDSQLLGRAGSMARTNAVRELRDEFGLTTDQARQLKTALDILDTSEGPAQQAQAASDLRGLLLDTYGTMQDMPPAVADIYRQLGQVVTTGAELAKSTADSADAAERLARVNMASGISAAAVEARNLAAFLGISLDKANAIAGVQEAKRPSVVGFGLGAVPTPGVGSAGLSYDGKGVADYATVTPYTPGELTAQSPGTSRRPERRTFEASENAIWGYPETGGRRGGGASEADKIADQAKKDREQMLKEAENIRDQQRTLREQYEADVAALDALLAGGAFQDFGGRETYNRAMDDLGDAFRKASQEADKARGAFAQTFSDVVRGAESASDVLEGIADRMLNRLLNDLGGNLYDSLFGGLLDGLGGGAAGGKGGGGSWWKNLLSFDGGGDTPSGPRSGGLDGKGGFLALMHPNESVTDHTKVRRSSGPRSLAMTFDFRGTTGDNALDEKFRRAGQEWMRQVPAYYDEHRNRTE